MVSILVFLELALGHNSSKYLYCSKKESFNPCFLGTCPRTIQLPANEQLPGREFQSLFSWNLPSDNDPGWGMAVFVAVSILVFLELALGHCIVSNGFAEPVSVSILVFLELALGL